MSFPARLNRPAHYLKPRRNGRSLIEGWFDPQTLYKIPRNPATVGLRALGRLAFLDHYRVFAEKLINSLDVVHAPGRAAPPRTERRDSACAPTVRGSTSSPASAAEPAAACFIDAAYTARHKLRQMGYADPDVVGVFLLPAAERGLKGPALANPTPACAN